MRRARSLKLIAGIAVAGLTLAACGSSTDAGSGGNTTTPQTTQTQTTTSASPTDTATSPTDTATSPTDTATSPTDATSPSEPQMTGDKSKVKVGLAYDVGGRGDQSFNDSAARGLDKAKAAGVTVAGELEAANGEPDSAKSDRLSQLIQDGATDIIAVGFAYAGPLGQVAEANPDTHFAIVDDNSLCDASRKGGALKNVDCMTFAANESSFLVGAAAALTSKTGTVGFIGGVNVPLLQTFQAGFDAGAKAAKADIKVLDKYISEPPDMSGFNDPSKGETIAKGMFDSGADVVYAAAGGSGAGVFKAAVASKTWGIGVDSDQYNQPTLADVKDVILTSAVKNVDVGVYSFIVGAVNGEALTGNQVYNLANGGVGFSTSGGFVKDIEPQLEELQKKIISGEIKVPDSLS